MVRLTLLAPGIVEAIMDRRQAEGVIGLATVRGILAEPEKPGRDLRPASRTASFAEGVETISVHQDGLVHISQLAERFVKDPHEVAKAGDVVKVCVTEVDAARKRIGLSMRKETTGDPGGKPGSRSGGAARKTAGGHDAAGADEGGPAEWGEQRSRQECRLCHERVRQVRGRVPAGPASIDSKSWT